MTRISTAMALSCALALAAVAAGSAQTPSAPPKPNACFFQRDVTSFAAADDHTVYLRVGVNDYYKLDLLTPCSNLNWSLGLGLRNRGGGPTICSPLDAELIVRLRGAPPDYCPVSAIRKLTASEVGALGKNKP